MKHIIYLCIALLVMSCHKEKEAVDPESIYNVNSKWENQDGKNVSFSDFDGKVIVTTMIFTSCKTACPRLVEEIRTISEKVGNADPKDIQYVLISIDPETDTPEVMKTYLQTNKLDNNRWTFIRSDEANTRELANLMAVKYKEISPIEFSHSNIISVYSKKGVLAFQKEGLNEDIHTTVKEVKNQLKF